MRSAGRRFRALFGRLNTFNFERVVRALEDAAFVESAYGREAFERDKNRCALTPARLQRASAQGRGCA